MIYFSINYFNSQILTFFASFLELLLGLSSEVDFQELVEPLPCLVQTFSDDCFGPARVRQVL